jgi:CDP-glucose 4,6-dehydratase
MPTKARANAYVFENVLANRRVFITGHTGFKGSWLAAWLRELGAHVTGYALPPGQDQPHFNLLSLQSEISHIEGDVLDAKRLADAMQEAAPEIVFHLAAQSLVGRSYIEPKLTFETNVGGSVNLLDAVRRTPEVRALVYVTSDKCYGHAPRQGGHRETDPLGGEDPYSASKACAELVFASYLASFFQTRASFAAASVRAGNVIGGGDWSNDRIVPDCIRALRSGRPVQVRNPRAIRPWQHVLEALSGYLLIASRLYLQGREYEGAWNFGPEPEGHRAVEELVDEVIGQWGHGSMSVIGGAEPAYTEAETLYLNCDKAHRRLGWRPTWNFAESVRRTVDWYRQVDLGTKGRDLTYSQIHQYMSSGELLA